MCLLQLKMASWRAAAGAMMKKEVVVEVEVGNNRMDRHNNRRAQRSAVPSSRKISEVFVSPKCLRAHTSIC